MEAQKYKYTPINKNEKYDKVMEELKYLYHICLSDKGLIYYTYNGFTRNLNYNFAPKRFWTFNFLQLITPAVLLYNRLYKKKYFKNFQNKNLEKVNTINLKQFLEMFGIKIRYSNWIKKNELIIFIKKLDFEKLFGNLNLSSVRSWRVIRFMYSDIVY